MGEQTLVFLAKPIFWYNRHITEQNIFFFRFLTTTLIWGFSHAGGFFQ